MLISRCTIIFIIDETGMKHIPLLLQLNFLKLTWDTNYRYEWNWSRSRVWVNCTLRRNQTYWQLLDMKLPYKQSPIYLMSEIKHRIVSFLIPFTSNNELEPQPFFSTDDRRASFTVFEGKLWGRCATWHTVLSSIFLLLLSICRLEVATSFFLFAGLVPSSCVYVAP